MQKVSQLVLDEYSSGLSIKEIASKFQKTENEIRSVLKTQVNWYNRSVLDLDVKDHDDILELYKKERSVVEISDIYRIPAPSVIKLLKSFLPRVYHHGRKYDLLKLTPFSKKQQEFIVGTLLGDGCVRRSNAKALPRLCLVHSKKFEFYFHWKIACMDQYINLWREQIDKRKNSVLLYTETLQHPGLVKFENMFYSNKIKFIPKSLDMYMTPFSLAVWFLDDGTLNSGTNHRIHTNCFSFEDQKELQSLLKRCFDLDCKIIQRKDEQYILSFNGANTIKLSNIIEPYVIPSMRYKLRLL